MRICRITLYWRIVWKPHKKDINTQMYLIFFSVDNLYKHMDFVGLLKSESIYGIFCKHTQGILEVSPWVYSTPQETMHPSTVYIVPVHHVLCRYFFLIYFWKTISIDKQTHTYYKWYWINASDSCTHSCVMW